MKTRLIYIYFIIIWLSISSASILVRLSNAPGSVCAFWRLLFTILLITPLLIKKRKFDLNYYALLSGLFLGFHFVFWMESLYMIPIVVSTVLVVTYPFYNLVFDYVLFHERVSRIQVFCLIVGFTCIVLYFNPGSSNHLNTIGLMYALLGGVFASIYFTIGKFLRSMRNMDLVTYIAPTYLSGLIVAMTYSMLRGFDLLNYDSTTYMFFILMAIIPMMGGHTLMNYLLKYVKTSTVTAIALGEPVGAGVLAYVLLGETVDFYKIILASIIIVSLLVIVHSETRRK